VISQVLLGLALPVPMIALLIVTQRHDVMRAFANKKMVSIFVSSTTGLVILLNGLLIPQTWQLRSSFARHVGKFPM